MTNGKAASIEDAFERALGGILARVSTSVTRIAVAYSGGLDSSVLLYLAQAYARTHRVELFAFHVHHGLSKNADGWLAHCEQECTRLGIQFDARRIDVPAIGRDGVEQAARSRRYAALGEICRLHNVQMLLTAHHQDDQVETVLLQLLRGSGLAGLSAMALTHDASELLGGPLPVLARPLLELSRAELEQFASHRSIEHIEDESNSDVRYSRNALRHSVTPVLEAHFPGFQQCIVRASRHAQSAQRLLDELAEKDLQKCTDGDRIDIVQFSQFSEDRQNNLLRYWFARHRVRMPSAAWLAELRVQLLCARGDAQVRVVHPDCEVRRYRGRAFLIPRERGAEYGLSKVFHWDGQSCIHFPEFRGSLHFDPAEEGVAADWLADQELVIRYRQGGEKLKAAPGRPTRSLKLHYQALDIPVWERHHLPVVVTTDRLLFAAGVGMNWKDLHNKDASRLLHLRWEKDGV